MANLSKDQRCTWVGCGDEEKHPQHSKDGSVWANLCNTHVMQLEAAMEDGAPAKVLGAWVKSQGGAKAAAERM